MSAAGFCVGLANSGGSDNHHGGGEQPLAADLLKTDSRTREIPTSDLHNHRSTSDKMLVARRANLRGDARQRYVVLAVNSCACGAQ